MIVQLPRTVLHVQGEGVRPWLDGLLTNAVSPDAVTFAALLTPQGKIIADLFVTPDGDSFLLDTPQAMGAELLRRLRMYVLRAPITVDDRSDTHSVHAVFGDDDSPLPPGVHPDPRHPSLGQRVVAPLSIDADPLERYDANRLNLGVPDSLFDFGPLELFPADACMDELNGVAMNKGCFIGQEVVSRMHRMSTVKKRLRGLILQGPASAGDTVQSGARRVGDVKHVRGSMGMALVRLDRMGQATEAFTVNGAGVTIMDGPNG